MRGPATFVLGLILAMFASCRGSEEKTRPEVEEFRSDLVGKRVLMVLAHRNFRDEEYREPREILETRGAIVRVASSSIEVATGMLGMKVEPDLSLEDVKIEEYDALLFIGGSGAKEYWDHELAHRLIKAAVEGGKIVGAICLAPVTLARAGVLEGKKATVFSTASTEIISGGATYTGASIEVDGNMVTASGPPAAKGFGTAIADLLAKGES